MPGAAKGIRIAEFTDGLSNPFNPVWLKGQEKNILIRICNGSFPVTRWFPINTLMTL